MSVTRSDVPYAMRPRFVCLEAGLLAFMYIFVLMSDPMLHPGYSQIAIATLLGLPIGLIFSLTAVRYVKELSQLSHDNPRMKWIGSFYYMPTYGAWVSFAVSLVAFLIIGLFGISAILQVSWERYPYLILAGLPLESVSKVRSTGVFALWPPTMMVYGGWIIGLTLCRMVRWYYSLPDNHEPSGPEGKE